jgi:geranylgeranyl diphosphate synthase type I
MIVGASVGSACDTCSVIPAPAETFVDLRRRVDDVLEGFLAACAEEAGPIDPREAMPLEEVRRIVGAGGKRLRPAFCYWGHRAAGASDGGAIVRAAASLELLHTMALIHDDLMDGSPRRRGVPASAPHLAAEAERLRLPVEPIAFGRSAAILTGDLAAVLADRLLLESGFDPLSLTRASAHYHRMRTEMAAGQFLDVAGLAREPAAARRAASLKGGSYTVVGPLLIGAALAGGPDGVHDALARYGEPLGTAFQFLDDLRDGEGAHGASAGDVRDLVGEARAALDPAVLAPEAVAALGALALLVGAT